jgi:hypothetical protein
MYLGAFLSDTTNRNVNSESSIRSLKKIIRSYRKDPCRIYGKGFQLERVSMVVVYYGRTATCWFYAAEVLSRRLTLVDLPM